MEAGSEQKDLDKDGKEGNKGKKMLVVVGRMGHGKSSFCKMIVDDHQRGKVKAEASAVSVTLECNLYSSNRFKNIFGEEIIVVDTPGLDSNASTLMVVEDIDNLIIEHKGQIVGIAYVIDIHQRELKVNGQNYIFSFLKFLRLKKYYKQNLTFCIISKFDKYYDEDQENKKIISQLDDIFHQNDSDKIWSHRIQWMSEPSGQKTKNTFEKKIKGEFKESYINQFEELNNILQNAVVNNYCLSFPTYLNDRQQFDRLLCEALIKDYHTFQYKNDTQQFEIIVQISPQSVMQRFFNTSVYFGNRKLKLASLNIIGFLTALFMNGYKNQIKSGVSEEEKQKIVSSMIEYRLKPCLIKAAIQKIQLEGRQFIFGCLPYITALQCFDEKNKQVQVKKEIKQIKEEVQQKYLITNFMKFLENNQKNEQVEVKKEKTKQKEVLKANLEVGINRAKFTYRLPSQKCSEKYLKDYTIKFYNNQA